MRRIHFFEFLDMSWLPTPIRETHLEYLDFVLEKLKIYDPAISKLHQVVKLINPSHVLVVCSGTGSFAKYTIEKIPELTEKIIVSDLYPSQRHYALLAKQGIKTINEPVNALDIPADLAGGVRVMTNALHHFKPSQVKQFIADSIKKGDPIFIIEISERSMLGILLYTLSLPFFWLAFLFTARKKARLIRRLVFGLFIPISFITVLFDGVISFLRSYRSDELIAMSQALDKSNHYEWYAEQKIQYGKLPGMQLKSFLFYSIPKTVNQDTLKEI